MNCLCPPAPWSLSRDAGIQTEPRPSFLKQLCLCFLSNQVANSQELVYNLPLRGLFDFLP